MRRASHLQFQGTTFPLWRDPSMRSAQRPRQPQPSGGRLRCPRGSRKGLCTGSAGCRARTGTGPSGPRPATTRAPSVFRSGSRGR